MNSEIHNCQNCKTNFTIAPEDFEFYEKVHVPAPTFCPDCQKQRRLSWRNDFSLYNQKCGLCAKSVVTLFSPNSGMNVYCNKCWWSDKWDPKDSAVDYDFSKPFFTQMNELIHRVPVLAYPIFKLAGCHSLVSILRTIRPRKREKGSYLRTESAITRLT